MTILSDVLKEIPANDELDRMRMMCDKIQEEESSKIENATMLPKGPNILLALEVPGRTEKEISFLTLERETPDKYIMVLFSIQRIQIRKEGATLKRMKVYEIDDHRTEKILTEYAKVYKFLRGE